MTRFLTFAVLALLPLLAWGEGYTCIEDMATGFAYENGVWQQAHFKLEGKFIIRPATEFDQNSWMSIALGIPKAKWGVGKLGEKEPIASCEYDFDTAGSLYCRASFYEFRMNRKSLRFLHAYLSGYWNSTPGDEAGDTPFINIGKCSPM
jgi:hypothetical protein